MPIQNIPFLNEHPYLAIKIINPHTGLEQKLFGLVDTGADECTIPALYAPLLGHNLTMGNPKTAATAGGPATGFGHTTTIEIYDHRSGDLLFTITNVIVDYMPGLHIPLLGVKHFLEKFELNIHYPNKVFSIRQPR